MEAVDRIEDALLREQLGREAFEFGFVRAQADVRAGALWPGWPDAWATFRAAHSQSHWPLTGVWAAVLLRCLKGGYALGEAVAHS